MQNGSLVSRAWLAGQPIVSVAAIVAAAMLLVAAMSFIWPRPVFADHNSLQVICPGPIQEGNAGEMKLRRSGYTVEYAIFFTHHGEYSAGPEDFEEYHGFKVETSSGQKTLRVPVTTKEDSLPEHDETFAIGFNNDGIWHQCVVTIEDDDAPKIDNVNISSLPADKFAYRAGESIDVTVDLDSKVEVDGAPLVSLYFGEGEETTWRGAEYLSGSGGRSLVFRYRVQAEDRDPDGIRVGAAAVDDSRNAAYGFVGNVFAAGTDVPIDYSHGGLQGDWRQSVDGRPFVQSARISSAPPDGWAAYRANQTVEVTLVFDTDVVVEGEVSVDLFLGLLENDYAEATKRARYLRGSGSDTLVFGYTVRPGDMDDKGIVLAMGDERYGFGGDGTIKAEGTDVERNPWYRGAGHNPAHKVDTAPPAISSVDITSRPANGDAYRVGELIALRVTFDEKVTVSGAPQLALEVGEVAHNATLSSMPEGDFGASLVFHYTVQEGDTDADGIGVGANGLKLNGGGIHDSAGNMVGLSFPALGADPGHKVGTP